MKNWGLVAAVGVITLLCASSVMALTTETRGDQNSDGTSKFADPDEQKPAFMLNAPGDGNGAAHIQSNGFSGVTLPSATDTTPGAKAFDDAMTRQQNRQ